MFNKARLSYTIFFTVSTSFFSLFFLGSWIAYVLIEGVIARHLDENLVKTVKGIRQIVETSATLSSRSYLRAVAEQHLATINMQYLRSLSGEISTNDAQQESRSRILVKAIGSSGYTYILNSHGVLQSHPVSLLQGKDISEWQFVKEQINRKKGFLEYEWQNPGEVKPREKVLYMDYFDPWDWIISVTAYRDELVQLINAGDFRNEIMSIKIAERGYPFVIDEKGLVLAHPTMSGNVLAWDNEYRELFSKMINAKQGKVFYDWPDPETKEKKKKVAVFETIDQLGWVVAASGYVSDFYGPLQSLKKLFIVLVCVGLLLAFIISYYLSTYITAPLNSLLKRISAEQDLHHMGKGSDSDKNEIEELSDHFSLYMSQLGDNNEKLRQLLEEQKKSSLDLNIYKEIFENIVEGIAITDNQGTIVRANPAFEKITGYSAEEAIGHNPRILKSDRHPPEFYTEMWSMIETKGYWSGKIWNKRKNGEVYPEWLTISAVRDKLGKVSNYAAVFNDITELVEHQERIQYLAYHDDLTGLPNRLMALEQLRKMISECTRKNEKLICLVCDLDNFKTFNDSLGHEEGDRLLRLVVDRLRPLLRLEDVLGRIGGDEFVILAKTRGASEEYARSISERVFSACIESIQLGEQRIYMAMSIGIALFPEDADEPDELIKRAMLALNSAEKTKGSSFCFYNPAMEIEVQKKISYLVKIREGLRNNEFIPFYQPKVNLVTGKVSGMEALARWISDGHLVSPGDFIPVAEDSGLIIQMSQQIYEKAFSETAALIEEGYNLKLSVNLSPIQLQSDSFLEDLLAQQQKSGLATEYIELEITESTLFENTDQVLLLLRDIVDAGFTISIDDFGTGYSSLQYLKQLPLNTLKIDMSFVTGIGQNQDDEQLVRTIALLAKQFGLQIVAEGVEEKAQAEFLRQLGCNDGQGYYFAKPMKLEDFRSWLNSAS
ncbi:bifunctional diguanylate cyclase/phosphodiesterase [Desulfopila aestuarii]|uniref:PAS domain S-box-containing protein/diguanylate cyclase (GGDEF) domain-containing protein n=1 Tax=Desulfopila aestuarii DSM 18488 TaxID=1121416 RepID=A0A1M7YHK8_9BACT|nr:EAL domain-containing protein [Desulfopila aestuarii]SHO52127.1 PAS domain S-box-containing protein/diguanylate cyclase (GGDEF) domain-containing protein [Desulfopila aestuarii DSM 18488]